MADLETASSIIFLVCLETDGRTAARPELKARLSAWDATRCLSQGWMIAANTTARIIYDSLADRIDDRDRLLVCEIDREAVWFNLHRDCHGVSRLMRHPFSRTFSC